jgi:hypothetical protein
VHEDRRLIGVYASRSDKPVARIHDKILDLSRMPVPGRALVAFVVGKPLLRLSPSRHVQPVGAPLPRS